MPARVDESESPAVLLSVWGGDTGAPGALRGQATMIRFARRTLAIVQGVLVTSPSNGTGTIAASPCRAVNTYVSQYLPMSTACGALAASASAVASDRWYAMLGRAFGNVPARHATAARTPAAWTCRA